MSGKMKEHISLNKDNKEYLMQNSYTEKIYLTNHQISQRTREPYGAALNSSGHGSNQSWDKDPPTVRLPASAESWMQSPEVNIPAPGRRHWLI